VGALVAGGVGALPTSGVGADVVRHGKCHQSWIDRLHQAEEEEEEKLGRLHNQRVLSRTMTKTAGSPETQMTEIYDESFPEDQLH